MRLLDLEALPALASLIYAVTALSLFIATLGSVSPRIFGRHVEVGMGALAMVLAYFIPQVIVLGIAATMLADYLGALSQPLGLVGLGFLVVSVATLSVHALRMHAARPTLDGALVRDEDQPFLEGLTDEERALLPPGQISWRPTLTLRTPAMLRVEVARNVVYREVAGVRLRLDVYRPREASSGSLPMIVYIHGGGWFMGTRRQSRYMMYELAASGWVVFSVSYRLAPRFPLPAAIEDTKAAVAWAKAHAAEYGARNDQVVVMGGSAGGHLAAMIALSPNNPRFQPGFEDADTRVDAAVLFYSATDVTGPFESEPNFGRARFFEWVVFRRRFSDDPELFRAVEPRSYVSPNAPPILLVHGERDGVVPIAQSRRLARQLREAGAKVHLLELPVAHHAFEVFPSPLHQRAVRVVVRFIASVFRQRDTSRSSPVERPKTEERFAPMSRENARAQGR